MFSLSWMELLIHMISLYFSFWRTDKCFQNGCAVFIVSLVNEWGLQFSHILANMCDGPWWYDSHDDRHIILLHFGSDLHFTNNNDISYLFICLLIICIASLKNLYSFLSQPFVKKIFFLKCRVIDRVRERIWDIPLTHPPNSHSSQY